MTARSARGDLVVLGIYPEVVPVDGLLALFAVASQHYPDPIKHRGYEKSEVGEEQVEAPTARALFRQ
jgi:hypothetical protein